jgi:hypothetical protein
MSPLFDRPPIDAVSVSDALFSSGTFRITGGPGITVGSDASGASIAGGGGGASFNYFDNAAPGIVASAMATTAIPYRSLLIQPLTPSNEAFPGKMTASTALLQFSMSHTGTSGGATSSFGSSVMCGIYSRVNSTQLSLLNSFNSSWTRAATSNISRELHGIRWLSVHSSQWSSLPAFDESRYYFGFLVNSANTSAQTAALIGQFLQGQALRSGTLGASMTSGNTGLGYYPFMGVYSVTTTGMPASIAASAMNQATAYANFIPNVVFNNVASSF